jgi:purine nucleoside phosphorylase
MKVAFISGTSIVNSDLFAQWEGRTIETAYGPVTYQTRGELGLRYNSLALIDNFANGLEGTKVDFTKFKALVRANQRKVNRLFARMLEILA